MNKINNKTLTVFSAVTLACSIIGFLGFFMTYRDSLTSGSGLIFSMPPLFEIIFGFMGIVLPLLMTVFFAKYNTDNAIKTVRILLISTLIYQLFDMMYLRIYSVLRFLIGFPFLICIIIATINSFTKLKNKKIIVIALALGILYKVLSVPTIISLMIRHLSYKGWFFLFSLPCEWVGIAGFYALLILFCLYSGVVNFNSASKPKKKAQPSAQMTAEISPAQMLKDLKEKADLGIISQEEYQAQRAQIISKL